MIRTVRPHLDQHEVVSDPCHPVDPHSLLVSEPVQNNIHDMKFIWVFSFNPRLGEHVCCLPNMVGKAHIETTWQPYWSECCTGCFCCVQISHPCNLCLLAHQNRHLKAHLSLGITAIDNMNIILLFIGKPSLSLHVAGIRFFVSSLCSSTTCYPGTRKILNRCLLGGSPIPHARHPITTTSMMQHRPLSCFWVG